MNHCRNQLTLYSGSPSSKIPAVRFSTLCVVVPVTGIKISSFCGYVAISGCNSMLQLTCLHFLKARPGRKPQVCRRKFSDICHTVEVLPVWIATLRFPVFRQSRSHLFTGTFWYWRGRKLCFCVRITTILTSDSFRCIESVTMTMCSGWLPITAFRFVRHLENVQCSYVSTFHFSAGSRTVHFIFHRQDNILSRISHTTHSVSYYSFSAPLRVGSWVGLSSEYTTQ